MCIVPACDGIWLVHEGRGLLCSSHLLTKCRWTDRSQLLSWSQKTRACKRLTFCRPGEDWGTCLLLRLHDGPFASHRHGEGSRVTLHISTLNGNTTRNRRSGRKAACLQSCNDLCLDIQRHPCQNSIQVRLREAWRQLETWRPYPKSRCKFPPAKIRCK